MMTITYKAAVPESITVKNEYLCNIRVLITNRHLAWLCSDAVRLGVKDFFFLSSDPSDAS